MPKISSRKQKSPKDWHASLASIAATSVITNGAGAWPLLPSIDYGPALDDLALLSSKPSSKFGPGATSNPLHIKPRPLTDPRILKVVHSWTIVNPDDGTTESYFAPEYQGIAMSPLPDASSYQNKTYPIETFEHLETFILPDGRPSYEYVPEADFASLCNQLKAMEVSSGPSSFCPGHSLPREDLSELLNAIVLDSLEEEESTLAEEEHPDHIEGN